MATTEPTTLGARLLRARLEYGSRLNPPRVITQTEVGREVGVSGVAVGGWEADRNEPGLEMLRELAKLYGVRVAWLAFNDGPMRDESGGGNTRPNHERPLPPVVDKVIGKEKLELEPEPARRSKPVKRRPGGGNRAAAG